MGNVQFLLSETNLGLEKYTYDAFGRPRITGWGDDYRATSNYGNRFLFTGREYLYTLGLYDYRHRVYHPGLGRFMQVDPIGFKGDSMNLYRYCGSNPVLHGDPMGTDYIKRQDPNNPNHYYIDIPILPETGFSGTRMQRNEIFTGINRRLSGDFGKWKLTTRAVPFSYWPFATKNTLEFRSGDHRSTVRGGNRMIIYPDVKSRWSLQDVGAHEGAHLLKRPDAYKEDPVTGKAELGADGNPIPKDGYDANNLLVNPKGRLSEADAEAIAHGNGKGVSSQHSPSTDDGRQTFGAYGSTTLHAAAWETTWGNGGWLATQKEFPQGPR